jgi:hypothetical protein
MRFISLTLLFALSWLVLTGETRAQYPPGIYSYNNWTAPYVSPYPVPYGGASYVSPYGYSSYYNYGAYPVPYYGYQPYYNSGTYIRPYVMAPYHSIYFDPFANTYRYSSGYLNSPRYNYYFR